MSIDAPNSVDIAAEKDLPQKEDTRLLGRVLGDVLRAQTGDAGFARVEAIRQTAIRFRRAHADEAPALRAELEALLNPLASAAALHVPISRISPTSPRTSTRIGAGGRTRSRARRRSAAASRTRWSAWPRRASASKGSCIGSAKRSSFPC